MEPVVWASAASANLLGGMKSHEVHRCAGCGCGFAGAMERPSIEFSLSWL